VTGADNTIPPPGWATTSHPSYVRIADEDSGLFTTPYGTQVLSIYTTTSTPTNVTTTSAILDTALAPNTTYRLTFNVARRSDKAATGYLVELLAIDDEEAVETVLDSATGPVGLSDLSEGFGIVFTTGSTHPNLGERVAIRLKKAPSADWMTDPHYDNVRLTAASSGP
jgi:hypothetical protein